MKFILLWFYIETRYEKLLQLFRIKRNDLIIPKGMYCYEWINKQGYNKTCKYYRSTEETKGIECTYTGHYGFDVCLYDRCKICGVNDEIKECDLC